MSCCQRSTGPHIAGQRWASGPATPVPLPQPPARLRFTGARALSLPVGTRRVLALPGDVIEGVSERERLALWHTGHFVDADAPAKASAPG